MKLKLYNSMSAQKELFVPLIADQVTLYVCGPTVYNRVHIGNARPAVVFDTLFRLLQTGYATVKYARNITDIDDKIMQAAKAGGETIGELSARFTAAYIEDMAALNNLPPTITPHATDHIPEMIALTAALIAKGHAYAAEGHVLFAVQSMPDYGKLAKRSLDDMLAGARVEVAAYRKYAGDFVLWKPSAADEPGWNSPWGRGRPGWHLECSAMIEKHLGETIDIHGGGVDLQFPHHENELAQSSCAHDGKTFVRYWMHNAYINIDGEKMSKSLGNFRMVNELLAHYPGEVLRFALLSAHYRSELNFSVDVLDGARNSLDTLYGYLQSCTDVAVNAAIDVTDTAAYQALLDDLNTPIAIRELHALGKKMKSATALERPALKSVMVKVAGLMGLLQQQPEQWFKGGGSDGLSNADIDKKVATIVQARNEKNYAQADLLRDELAALGISLTRDGWRRD